MTDDRNWVAATAGGTVTRFEQATAGKSRATWLVDVERPDGAVVELVLRRDTGDGPLSGTELNLARERAVYGALAGTDVRAPALWAASDDGEALLVERVHGTEDLTAVADQQALGADFADAVATLHNIDVGTLDLPGFTRPASAEEHATAEIGLWRRVLDGCVRRPAPLLRFAFRLLEDAAPVGVERTVLCHGDLGPGNFLHHDGAVTALLDWEFAHLGDPMDDIAWWTIRHTHVTALGDLDSHLERYSAATGLKIEPDRVRYYQALVLTRMAVACLAGLDRRGSNMDRSTYLMLLPLLQRQLTTLLAERLGVAVDPAEIPAARPATARSEVLDVIANDLGSVILPDLGSAAGRARTMGAVMLVMHLQTAETLGGPLDEAESADIAALIGEQPATVEEGHRALEAAIDAGGVAPADLVRFFSRSADRSLALWPVVAAAAARPLPEVRP